jgi:diguanylate cyclase (GGDEF)-like protein/PAS domain S-box-containing protein
MNSQRQHLRLLLVEDSPQDCELILHEFKHAGFDVEYRRVQTRPELEEALQGFDPDVILCDFTMPRFSGAEALSIARTAVPDTPFIFVSGTIGEERAVEAMRLGATDYVLKDRLRRLTPAVTRALEEAHERSQHRQAQAALRESEERFRSFMQHVPGRASAVDAEGRYTYVNENWLSAFGKTASDVVGRTHDEVWPAERAVNIKSVHRQVVETNQPVRRVFTAGSGHDLRWWLSNHFPIPDEQGRTALVGTIAVDITEQKTQEEKIARLSRIHAVLSGINSAIVRIRDRQELFDEACRIAVEHGNFGLAWIGTYDPDTLDLTPVASARPITAEIKRSKAAARADAPIRQELLGRAIRERRPVFDNDLSIEIGAGDKRRQEALQLGYRSVIVMPLFEQEAVAGCLSMFAKEPDFFTEEELKLLAELAGDISFALEHIGKEEKLNYLAYYDALTGLPNRTLFFDRLVHELHSAKQEGRKVALVLGDIKRLRFVNESFGRQTGDALLREIAARWKSVWPDPDHVARIAAECLAGIIRDIKEPADVAYLLEKSVNEALTASISIGGKELGVSLSIGIAIFPTDGDDPESLFRNADAALNNAKKNAAPYLFYQPAMNATVAQTLLLESKMRRAIEKEQFLLHFQPKLDLRTGRLSGMEALIRWNDPDAGLVSPAQFIPLLEDTGMIHDAGRWAIRNALEHYRRWQQQGLRPPRIAVNVSAIQLKQIDFVDIVRHAMEEYKDSLHGLDLEITESMIMEDIEGNIEKLRALQAMGVNIAIDDFGTGYSSLGYLAKLPVNALKIDRSFIVTMCDNPDSMTIVSAIISLAHSLSLKVIAEGVELQEQWDLLKVLQCDELQGYLYSRPLPAGELISRFNRE